MPAIPNKPQTEDSTTFSPDAYFEAWSKEEYTPPYDNDFRKFIIKTFGLPFRDDYGYMAQSAEVTLLQAQTYVEWGAQGNLHAWYHVAAYTDIFRPSTNTAKALTALSSNAKKGSVRADIAKHLLAHYHPASPDSKLAVSKSAKQHTNPYFDLWAWSCQNLEWAGPEEGTAKVKISHAMLPVLYHHFGCICPSYEALETIRLVAKGRRVLDLGSGNGYWTYMLRRMEPVGKKEKRVEVVAVDSGMSEWRTVWVGDTVEMGGKEWLEKYGGGREAVLLLVYPMVGGEFTSRMIGAYRQFFPNASGFTGFAKETIAEWMAREMPGWKRVLQMPLPSFAGKDEALFVFEKGDGGEKVESVTA
ncbi:hypothetical protein B0A54_16221 [Friedmanniomyces endolithicus]|uniref:Methyltransferase domain-containing protein n=1 Tax=Friedmanniomyces endolithicus TaxID=329885 RepID=A0A4V5N4N8_9PEZI|nr:hypothetical protein B0A54_16221 [Friedmanniomyces endolithicus]